MSRFDGGPQPVVALHIDLICSVISEPSPAELPVERILWVITIAAVHDSRKRLNTRIFVKVSNVFAHLQDKSMFIWCALMVSGFSFPPNFMIWGIDVITTESLDVFVHPVSRNVACAAFVLPTLELVCYSTSFGILTEHFGT